MAFKVPHDEEKFGLRDAFIVARAWRADDTYPRMRKLAVAYLAPRVALLLSTVVLLVHAVWAAESSCSINFQRGGSPVVFISARLYALIEWHSPKVGLLSGGKVEKLSLFNPLFILPVLGAVGTLVWGYGDLLPFFGSGGC